MSKEINEQEASVRISLRIPKVLNDRLLKYKWDMSKELNKDLTTTEIVQGFIKKGLKNFKQ